MAGHQETWPTVELTGPADLLTVTNEDTGESWEFDPDWNSDGSLDGGDTVTITTDPIVISGPEGRDWSGGLNWPDAQIFPLDPGSNNVSLVVVGAAEGTAVSLSWSERWETP